LLIRDKNEVTDSDPIFEGNGTAHPENEDEESDDDDWDEDELFQQDNSPRPRDMDDEQGSDF
jgi:hypothetical protein